MSNIVELIKEAHERNICRVEKEDELYRLYAAEIYMLQDFIGWIEADGYRVFIYEGPEQVENTALYSLLVGFVKDEELPEEEQGQYTVIC